MGAATAELDVASVLKASQAISGEIVLPRLLDRLMRVIVESAGARRGVLLLDRDGTLHVEAEHRVDEEHVHMLTGTPLAERADLATSVVTYVARTREAVLLDDRAAEGPFGHDPYLARPPSSLLAAPILYQGRLAGVVYLENDLTSLAFTPDRVEIIRLLSTQIAISIENATLVADLERKVEERTRALKQAHDEILLLERAEQERKEREVIEQREVIERQQQVIHELSTPIIEVWDGVITVPLIGALDDSRTDEVMIRLLQHLSRTRSRYAILDLTGADVVDTHTADSLLRIVRAVRLLGARAVVSGIQPAVAQTMVQLGAELGGLVTRATLREALRFCMSEPAAQPASSARR